MPRSGNFDHAPILHAGTDSHRPVLRSRRGHEVGPPAVSVGVAATLANSIILLCRTLVERFWANFLPPKWMATLKKNLLGGHVADVVAAYHGTGAMIQAGGGSTHAMAATDLTTLMKGMVSSFSTCWQRNR